MSATNRLVDFTTANDNQKICQRCKIVVEDGSTFEYLQSRSNSNKPGKWLCSGCLDYYNAKGTLMLTEVAKSGQIILAQQAQVAHQQAIQKLVAQAQRQGTSGSHLVRVSNSTGTMPPPPIPGPSAITAQSASKMPWPKRHMKTRPQPISKSRAASSHTQKLGSGSGPNVSVPGVEQAIALNLPHFLKHLPLNPTFPDAHGAYNIMRNWLASRASNPYLELIILKSSLTYMKEGNKRASIVLNITETIDNVPVHIGKVQLKLLCYLMILPLFLKWSNNESLLFEDVHLRTTQWVEMVPPMDVADVNAISRQFFMAKGKDNVVRFHPGKGAEFYIELDYKKYLRIVKKLEDSKNPQPKYPQAMIDPPRPKTPVTTTGLINDGQQSDHSSVTSAQTDDLDHGHVFPVRKRNLSKTSIQSPPRTRPSAPGTVASMRHSKVTKSVEEDSDPEPTAYDIERALQAQTAIPKMSVRSVLNTKAFECIFYPMPFVSLFKLVAVMKRFHAIEDCDYPISGKLTFDSAPNAPAKYGSFKKALFGHTSKLVVGLRHYACIKQCWYLGEAGSDQRLIYDNATQVKKITSEMNCLRWATALMDLVYKFIQQGLLTLGNPPFTIPNMQFVQLALCILENNDTYMIEEVINGKFIKYLGNNSAALFIFASEDCTLRANFLVFCQHVQYVKTHGKVLIGDFQGSTTLLTDPQIITSPEISRRRLFADGNLGATIILFPQEHECNEFCDFFKLPSLASKIAKTFDSIASTQPEQMTKGKGVDRHAYQ